MNYGAPKHQSHVTYITSTKNTIPFNNSHLHHHSPHTTPMSTATEGQEPPPWWASFPDPKAPVHALEPEDVQQLLESHASAGPNSIKSFLLVDVRRTDWEGGTVTTAINFPAHTLYQTRPAIYQLCKQADIKTIIFFCGKSTRLVHPRKISVRLRVKQEAQMAVVPSALAGCKTISTR